VRTIKVKIRVMEPRDIVFAIRLTDTEGWGFTHQDFLRLLRLDSRGCFVAVDGNKKVGLINTTTYDRIAWIGNVIVAESARGKGVGIQLLNRAISYLEAKRIGTIGLYSYLETRSLYEEFGFVETQPFLRYAGVAKARPRAEVKPFRCNLLKCIAKFDSARFGADRRKLLKLLWNEYPEFCFFFKDYDKIVGYIAAKGAQFGYEIGPWVCDAPHSAKSLLQVELNKMSGKTVEVTVPKRNRHAADALTRLGLSFVGEVVEMFRGGLPARRVDSIFAAGGLEKG
jgi:ribosomal protein S18 acetylase RimI-like enzyme